MHGSAVALLTCVLWGGPACNPGRGTEAEALRAGAMSALDHGPPATRLGPLLAGGRMDASPPPFG